MQIATAGVVLNQFGQVLLIRRNDTRTLAPPGGSVESGELPTESVIREVREETGLIVMPTRLVGLYFWPTKPEGMLSLVFRCIQRGGEIETSNESPQVGFFGTNPLPKPMLAMHRHRIRQAIRHAGGPPQWEIQPDSWRLRFGKFVLVNLIYRAMNLHRLLLRRPAYTPPLDWRANATIIVRNQKGDTLWVRSASSSEWKLPSTDSLSLEPPWRTAVRAVDRHFQTDVTLSKLSGVYLLSEGHHIRFAFTAECDDQALIGRTNGMDSAFFSDGEELQDQSPLDRTCLRDATEPMEQIAFRREVDISLGA